MTVPEFDVIVIGGGIAGVSAGASLAAARKVLVIEAESQPGYHASGRSAAYFAPAYGNAAVRLMTLDSQDFYEAPPVEFAKDLLKPRGAVFLARQNELDLLEDMAAEQPELERVSAEAIRAQVPIIHSDVVGGLFDPIGGDLDVHAILQGYLKQLRVRGGTLQTDARVLGLDRVGEHWQVRCRDGLVASAKIVVNAAGAWADEVGLLAGLAPLGLQPKRRTAC
jgi:D-arginine dehydrogenase